MYHTKKRRQTTDYTTPTGGRVSNAGSCHQHDGEEAVAATKRAEYNDLSVARERLTEGRNAVSAAEELLRKRDGIHVF